MRVSSNWLKELVDIEDNTKEIADKMLFVGNEYDSINEICPCTNLVVGKVLKREDHPDSDHLNVCQVDLGDGIYQIVCGAPNVDANEKVIVSKVGAILPGGEIKKGVIRGVESNGMICSLAELGLESKYVKDEDKKGIHILSDDAPIGMDAKEYLCFNDEYVDYELTANRGDLLSMLGMAYESAAIYNKKVKLPKIDLKEIKENTSSYVNVINKTDDCHAYTAKVVKNVVIKESPNFIKARLMASGIRPINNVVDISNYVMLLYGQPLHFFDLDKIGKNIIIRKANKNEEMNTLDGNKRVLKESDIVIANDNGPVALAGVMGGLESEVTEDTKNILIESAIFEPLCVRKTSKEILRSEASIRFEKGIDPNRVIDALNMAAYLLQEYANGEPLTGYVGFNNKDLNDKHISISLDKINKVLGMTIDKEEVIDIFNRLGFKVDEKDNIFDVYVPTRRLDVNIKEDLIEEVGRIHGYSNMSGTIPASSKNGKYLSKNKYIKDIKNRLRALGLNEVITYSLVNDEEIKLFKDKEFNPIKVESPLTEDKKYMRYSLIPSLLKVADYNISRSIKDITIYETSKIYYDDVEVNKLAIVMTGNYVINDFGNSMNIDFYTIKGVLENLFDYLGLNKRYRLERNAIEDYHPGISASIIIDNECIGYIGRVHPNINKKDIYALEIDLDKVYNVQVGKIKFKEIPKYPSVIKDMAFIVDNDIDAGNIISTITKKGGRMISNVTVFDVFTNIEEGKKSIAFKLTFQDLSKTLTDEEVTESFNKIISVIEKEYNAVLRNK